MADIRGKASQVTPTVVGEGDLGYAQMSKIGELFTAGWEQRLVRAGLVYRVTVGTVTADTDLVFITGGGAGTTLDEEQPEIAIGVDSGYLIPMRIDVACYTGALTGALGTRAAILAIADRTAATPTSVTGTIETPANLLDGGPAFSGRAYSAITADIADPTADEILCAEIQSTPYSTSAGFSSRNLNMHYEPKVPSAIVGPGAIYVYWFGTQAVGAIGTVVFAHVPASYFPTS